MPVVCSYRKFHRQCSRHNFIDVSRPSNTKEIFFFWCPLENVPLLEFSCERYSYVLSDCTVKVQDQCYLQAMYNLWVRCTDEILDYRVCRKINSRSCRDGACANDVGCVDGDGSLVPKLKSFCAHCPVGFFGDGDNCTGKHYVAYENSAPSLTPSGLPRKTSERRNLLVLVT